MDAVSCGARVRPKKIILIVNPDEKALSVLSYTLFCNGYRVLKASTQQEAVAIFATGPMIDLVVIDEGEPPKYEAWETAKRIKLMRRYMPMLILTAVPENAPADHVADAVLASTNCSSQDLLERIKVMSARKRGQRKGAQRHQNPKEEERKPQ